MIYFLTPFIPLSIGGRVKERGSDILEKRRM
jgi:hypothetical protein